MPSRLAFCITELDPGGAERAFVELVTRLPRQKWESQVFCLGPEAELAGVLRERGIPITCLGARSALDCGVVFRLAKHLREFRPELLQTFLFHANVAGRIAGIRAGVPVIVSGLRVAEQQKSWHVWVDRWSGVARFPAVCVSQGVADWAHTTLRIPREKLHVIPNGVDFQRFAEAQPLRASELGLPDEARLVVGIGRLHPQKGFDLLIDAMAPLFAIHPDLHLLLAGEGAERGRLETLGRQIAPGRVHLPGRISDIPGLLKRAQLFVLSSRWEGMPNVLLEALAAGTPVIATRVEGVSELLNQPQDPRIVNSASSEELQSVIQQALDHPESWRELSKKSQDIIHESFTLNSVAEGYAALYFRLLKLMNR